MDTALVSKQKEPQKEVETLPAARLCVRVRTIFDGIGYCCQFPNPGLAATASFGIMMV